MSTETQTAEDVARLRPWPYRKKGDPLPSFCGKCGRTLLPYAWGESDHAYLELACAGRLQAMFARGLLPRGLLFFVHHYEFVVGQVRWWQYDPETGKRQKLPWNLADIA